MNDARWKEMAAAYALGALDADERRAFEARLASDPELRHEVESFRASLVQVDESLPLHMPPASLKTRVLERARQARPAVIAGGQAPAGPTRGAAPSRTGGGRAPLPWILLAASLAGLVWLGLTNRDLSQRATALSDELTQMRTTLAGAEAELARLDSLAQVLVGGEVRFATLTGETPPTLRLVWNAERRVLVVAASNLPAPPAGRTYQLWGIRGNEAPVSLGTFETGPGGTAVLTLSPGTEPDFDVSALTEEPAGGSPQPTSQPFLVGAWRSAQD